MVYQNTFNLVACKAEPKEQAELVTQLLYGEYVEKIEENGNWIKVKITHDGYECYIDKKIFSSFSNKQNPSQNILITKPVSEIDIDNKKHFILAGSYLNTSKGIKSQEAIKEYRFEEITEYTNEFIGAPYLWGGRSIFGIDCSGLSQLIYRIVGINIKRDASQQVLEGKQIDLKNAITGDLAFFTQKTNKVSHVGIIIKDADALKIIHASGQVRMDVLDEKGIYDFSKKEYSHKFHSVRNYL